MAPFPEEEIMTIKRLEVALRKSDFKLLKEGAYKLHEKYHQHHHFQYLDLLRGILNDVQLNYAIPSEIKDILIPTIQDILSNSQEETQNRVSSLTSLSYGINQQETPEIKEEFQPQSIQEPEKTTENEQKENYIKPFQEFTPIKPIELISNETQVPTNSQDNFEDNQDSKLIAESFNEMPSEDFDTETPVMHQQNIFENTQTENSEAPSHFEQKNEYELQSVQEEKQEEKEELFQDFIELPKEYKPSFDNYEQKQEVVEENLYNQPMEAEEIEEIKEESQQIFETEAEIEQTATTEEVEDIKEVEKAEEQKTITIFFGQNSSSEKIKNILKYRDLIKSHGNFSLGELISLVNEIKLQADTNVSELQTFIEQLKSTNHKINIVTNSQSSNLVDLFNQTDTTYSIFEKESEKRINLLPIFGLTNLYKCFECNSEYLETNEKINSFILQCPKCKSAMLPDLYCPQGEVNLDYYNSGIVELANSNILLLIHPSVNEKLSLNMIKSSAKVSSKLQEVYILDKDINARETYRKIFDEINPNIKVVSDISAIEDFLNNI